VPHRNPYEKALRLSKEILQDRDDVVNDGRWNMVDEALNLIGFGATRSEFGFSDRYKRDQLSFHLHWICAEPILGPGWNRRRPWQFCAILQHGMNVSEIESGGGVDVAHIDSGGGDIQVSVLVDVREHQQTPEHLVEVIPSVVRLQLLQDCHYFFREPILDLSGETRWLLGQWEVAGAVPVFPSRSAFLLDEFEKDVIKGGSTVVQNLANQNRNFDRRLLGDVQFLYTLRLGQHFARVTLGVFPDGVIKSLAVVCDNPHHLCGCGIEAGNHP
jgi:hypothetical protein